MDREAPELSCSWVLLLIVDELGYVPFTAVGSDLLFEVFSQRYERGATLVTSNLPFDEWTSIFGSERLTGALFDRLTHHVHILAMNGESYRLATSKKAQRRPAQGGRQTSRIRFTDKVSAPYSTLIKSKYSGFCISHSVAWRQPRSNGSSISVTGTRRLANLVFRHSEDMSSMSSEVVILLGRKAAPLFTTHFSLPHFRSSAARGCGDPDFYSAARSRRASSWPR